MIFSIRKFGNQHINSIHIALILCFYCCETLYPFPVGLLSLFIHTYRCRHIPIKSMAGHVFFLLILSHVQFLFNILIYCAKYALIIVESKTNKSSFT